MLNNKRRRGASTALGLVIYLYINPMDYNVNCWLFFIWTTSWMICVCLGYLPCAKCSASGVCLSIDPIKRTRASSLLLQAPTTERCLNCSGAGKVKAVWTTFLYNLTWVRMLSLCFCVCLCMNQVMCPTCLCTGMVTASEHDPRFDPFD